MCYILPISSIPKLLSRGFTLIEVLIASAIISIAGAAILSTAAIFLRVSGLAQDTVRAQNLANDRMEILKNMPYDELATQQGAIYPPGNLPDSETVTINNNTYVIHTYISFVDDPFDGDALGNVPGKPIDFFPFDYKRATIEVRDRSDQTVLAKISTNISANAAETSDDTGILFLQVLDSGGNPVPNANVHLTNSNPNPDVDIITITDTNGKLQIPLLPEDTTNGYHLEVSLPGYSTDQTYPDNIVGYDPVQPDFNILAQQVTTVTLAIDLLASMDMTVVDESGNPVSGFGVTVTGDKIIYVDPTGVNPDIPKFSQVFTTNSSGIININNLEWGSYGFSVPSGYYIISSTPYQTVSLPAGSNVDVTLKVTTDLSWPRINQVNPTLGVNIGVISVEVLGANLPVGSSIELRRSGQPTIVATGVVSSDLDTKLTGNLDITGAAAGVWDVVVSVPSGKSTVQSSGFTVTTP